MYIQILALSFFYMTWDSFLTSLYLNFSSYNMEIISVSQKFLKNKWVGTYKVLTEQPVNINNDYLSIFLLQVYCLIIASSGPSIGM